MRPGGRPIAVTYQASPGRGSPRPVASPAPYLDARSCRIAHVACSHAYALARMFTRSLEGTRGFAETSGLTPPASQIAEYGSLLFDRQSWRRPHRTTSRVRYHT